MKCIVVILPGSISIHQVYKQKKPVQDRDKIILALFVLKGSFVLLHDVPDAGSMGFSSIGEQV
jgi:hypothetical protein